MVVFFLKEHCASRMNILRFRKLLSNSDSVTNPPVVTPREVVVAVCHPLRIIPFVPLVVLATLCQWINLSQSSIYWHFTQICLKGMKHSVHLEAIIKPVTISR